MDFIDSANFDIFSDAIAFLLSKPSQHQHTHQSEESHLTGFWGPVDASVDWCEHNYVVTPYIAEFWNTLSAVPMFLWAAIGWWLCYTAGVSERRFKLLLCSLGFMGIGSVCFHGTLRYHAQLLDEMPLMICSYCSLFCALELKQNKPRKFVVFSCLSAMLIHGLTYCVFEFFGIFILGFSVVMLTQIYIIALHVIADWKEKKCASQAFWLALIGFAMLSSSFTAWNLENAFCNELGQYKLHAMWHLFGGYGLYLLDLLLILLRGSYLKKEANVKFSSEFACHYIEWIDV